MGITGIVLIAFLFRFIGLSSLPNGVFTDEIVSGYVGRFILENGKDVYGNSWPLLYFNKFGDYRVIFPMYLAGLATHLFGTDVLALRFFPALFGTLAVLSLYWFVLRLTGRKLPALLSGFLLAITPWHVVLSRAESEGIVGLTLMLTGGALYLSKGTKDHRIAVLLFILTYFFYPAFRLVSPLFAFLLLCITPSSKTTLQKAIPIVLTILTVLLVLTPYGSGRFAQTSFFSDPQVAEYIDSINSNYAQAHGRGNAFIAYIFHNKVTAYAREFVIQYFNYLSPSFLLFEGGKPDRYTTPLVGLIPITVIFLAIFALVARKTPRFMLTFSFLFLIIAFLPAAITTYDVPNVHRSLAAQIPFVILGGIGLSYLVKHQHWIWKLTAVTSILVGY